MNTSTASVPLGAAGRVHSGSGRSPCIRRETSQEAMAGAPAKLSEGRDALSAHRIPREPGEEDARKRKAVQTCAAGFMVTSFTKHKKLTKKHCGVGRKQR